MKAKNVVGGLDVVVKGGLIPLDYVGEVGVVDMYDCISRGFVSVIFEGRFKYLLHHTDIRKAKKGDLK